MIDATIIHAPASTKNKAKQREPKMHSTRKNSSIRARVEHCFRVMKCQFGYKKVRYKGLDKNRTQVFSLLGLMNLYMHRKQLVG